MKFNNILSTILLVAPAKGYGFHSNQQSQKPRQSQHHKIRSSHFVDSYNNDDNDGQNKADLKRREAMKKILQSSIIGFAAFLPFPQKSHAACLSGDTSVDCIGIYKVPIDEGIRYMIDTPEQLAKFAPDLRWTPPVEYPKNYQVAKDEIMNLKNNVQQLPTLVSKGELTSAGVEILRIVPRITVAGRVIIEVLNSKNEYSMKALRMETAHNELLANLGSADVIIGQSNAGQLGSITMAQIQILEELRNADEHFEEIVRAMPEGYSG